MFTLNDLVRRAVLINRNGDAIRTREWSINWQEFEQRVERIASALVENGLQKGERVAMFSLNNPVYYQFLYAVIWAGGIAVPINTRFSQREMVECVNELRGCWLCADENFSSKLAEFETDLEGIKGHYFVGKGETPEGYRSLEQLQLQGANLPLTEDPLTTDTAMIFFTGGTTGRPKGVMLTHQQLKHGAQQMASGHLPYDPLREHDCYLHSAPMFHMADGIMCFMSPMVACANVFMERFDIAELVTLCKELKVSWLILVPTMLKALCDHIEEAAVSDPELRDNPIPTLKGVNYGGSPIPKALLTKVMQTFPGLQLFHGYGATEALIITQLGPTFHTLDEENTDILKSVGKPFRGVMIGIFDPDGNRLPNAEIGEIYVRSNSIMKGYWHNPDLTRDALKNSWYHTGDSGYLNDDGFLFLVDRVKDMIITGGENVYSAEVENVLSTLPAIDEVAIIGKPDPKWTEIVHAVIKFKPGQTATEDEIKAHCREFIAGYKVPKSVEFRTEPLPKTSVGKVDKVALRKSNA